MSKGLVSVSGTLRRSGHIFYEASSSALNVGLLPLLLLFFTCGLRADCVGILTKYYFGNFGVRLGTNQNSTTTIPSLSLCDIEDPNVSLLCRSRRKIQLCDLGAPVMGYSCNLEN